MKTKTPTDMKTMFYTTQYTCNLFVEVLTDVHKLLFHAITRYENEQ